MQNYVLTADQIIVRLIAAVVLGGIIGFEREYKSHPAGLKTHILVCVGSAMIALIQEEITWQALHFATEYPEFVGVIRSDQARLVAQVISGIGFLGAGTIILSKGAVRGLTTAASVWAVAALGIAIGMGYYRIAAFSFLAIMVALTVLSRLTPLGKIKRLEIQFTDLEESKQFVESYFKKHEVRVDTVDFEIRRLEKTNHRLFHVIYHINLPRNFDEFQLVQDLSESSEIKMIRILQ